MKAVIYLGKGAVEVRKLDLPEVGDDDVLVQNLYIREYLKQEGPLYCYNQLCHVSFTD